jgi:adenylate cyclase
VEIEKLRNIELKAEKEKSDTLLLNILPAEVAEELKIKGNIEARLYENVTVLFTDFQNFTGMSQRLSPKELIDELHACFSAFDLILEKHGIEKIKTVGDAYLAAAGVPVALANHAEETVRAAIEIRDFMLQRRKELAENTFEIRIGIHSGSVVAGIVGLKKFAYDIWGDTVNTAARMEQNSEPGKINISEDTFDLIKNRFKCCHRGKIDAKNKGLIDMYFVGS